MRVQSEQTEGLTTYGEDLFSTNYRSLQGGVITPERHQSSRDGQPKTASIMNHPLKDNQERTRARVTSLEVGTYQRSPEHILARQHTGAREAYSRQQCRRRHIEKLQTAYSDRRRYGDGVSKCAEQKDKETRNTRSP